MLPTYSSLLPSQPNNRRTFIFPLFCGILVTFGLIIFRTDALQSSLEYASTLAPSYYTLSSCPSPHDDLAATHLPLRHDTQSCRSLPSAHPEFQSYLCHDPAICNSFTFRVQRTDDAVCRAMENDLQPSEDPALNDFIKSQRGPDAFFIRTDGAQRYAATWSTYENNCSYSFDVRISNPGPVYLEAWQTFARYESFSETNSSWPEMRHTPLLKGPVSLSICGSHCKPAQVPLTLPNRTIVDYPPTEDLVEQTLPACSGPEPIRGSYLPSHLLDMLAPPFDFTSQGKPVVGRYHFVPAQCEWRHAGTRFGPVSQCTTGEKKKRVLFMGDSHGRVAFDGVVHRLQGNQSPLTKSQKAGSKQATVGNTHFEFTWDPRGQYLTKSNCTMFDQPTEAFVFSSGAHWAADSTTARFKLALSSALTHVLNCPNIPKTLIYLTAPAAPQRQDHFIQEHKDHRANVRLHYWADESARMAREAGFMVVDQFDLTMPHVEEPMKTDMAHYLNTDALDPILDDVIGKLGLCPDVE